MSSSAAVHYRKQNNDAWLSLVERCVRDAEVAGSNPVASTLGRGAEVFEKSNISVFLLFSTFQNAIMIVSDRNGYIIILDVRN